MLARAGYQVNRARGRAATPAIPEVHSIFCIREESAEIGAALTVLSSRA
jgi:hypothetical protein